MRTMLISLILICSLAQLASAGPPVEVDSGGCGTVYTCFAPEKCKNPTTVATMADSSVVEIKKGEKVLDDCEAIIRIYRYTDKKTYVSIESFQDTVKKIELIQSVNMRRGTFKDYNRFSCEIDSAGKKIAKSMNDEQVVKDITADKLKCVFETTEKINNVIQRPTDLKSFLEDDDKLRIVIGNPSATTKETAHFSKVNVRCNPTDYFSFENPRDKAIQTRDKATQTKLYKPLSTENRPEKYECDEEHFEIEYKKSGTFVPAKEEVTCDESNAFFAVFPKGASTPDEFYEEDELEIRCVAEAKFFCKYLPKVKVNEASPIFEEKPDGNSLKCPPEKPYFVIVGITEQYLINPDFKCMAVGAGALWTIDFNEAFTKDGPVVYCTDKKRCLNPISASVVDGGTLGSDALPKCFKYGTLKTTDGKLAANFTCDSKIGEYKYTVGGEEIHINPSSKFICEYPAPPEQPTFDKATTDKIQTGIYVAIGVSAFVIIGSIVASCFLMKQKMKKKKKELLAQQAYDVQWLTKAEKALLAEKNPPKSGEKSKPDEKIADEQKAPGKLCQFQNVARMKGAKLTLKDRKDLNDDKLIASNKKSFQSRNIEVKEKKRMGRVPPLKKLDDTMIKGVVKHGRTQVKGRATGKVQKDE